MSANEEDKSYLDTKIGYFKKDPNTTTIYVGNLVYEKTELDLKDLFEEFGSVNYVKLIKDPETHKSKGIAFVQMINKAEATSAISALNGSQVDGRTLKVNIAEESKDHSGKKKRRKPYKPYVSKKDRGIE